MRKVIGIGETILDILFKDGQPMAAVPGGSVFNGIVSLGRAGVPVSFIGETGDDRVGRMTLDFMRENNVDTEHVCVYSQGKSPVSLAFLDERNDAEYLFYKDYPSLRLDVPVPEVDADDIVMIGSYYAIAPQLRDKLKELLDHARDRGALVYYDVNFRSTHRNESIKLLPAILENFEYADLVRGSMEDFRNMFGLNDADSVYQGKVEFYCPRFICTDGGADVRLYAGEIRKAYPVPLLQTVSTVGAGDNFNAGIVFGLLKQRIRRNDLDELTEADWDCVIRYGMEFGANVCMSLSNSVSREFAASLR